METTNDFLDRLVTIERTFDAPLSLVWEAWTQAEHLANWWGPKGATMDIVLFEFKVGGKWKFSMPMPNGQTFVTDGEYLEIVAQKKIVTTANFRPMTEGVELHIEFSPEGEQTHFRFNVLHPTVAYKLQQEKMGIYNGWGSAFDRLDELLRAKA